MAWQSVSVVPGNPTKAIELNTVQANITAQANGDVGAPKQQQAGIDAGAVGQAQLKTSVSIKALPYNLGVGSSVTQNFILDGGQYGFYPTLEHSAVTGNLRRITASIIDITTNAIFSQDAYIHLTVAHSTGPALTGTVTASQVYIDASPPYNVGDGDISNFTYVKLDSNDNVIAVSSSETPPWMYNGPTSTRPDLIESVDGVTKKYKNIITLMPTAPWEGGDPDLWQAGPVWEMIEIDHALKNADMSLIPHPFGEVSQDETVVLLDPCCSLTDSLTGMNNAGENVANMIINGYIELGETLDCCTPDGVIAVRPSWKNTGA